MSKQIVLILISFNVACEAVAFQSAARRVFIHAAARLRKISLPKKRLCVATSIIGGGAATVDMQPLHPNDQPKEQQSSDSEVTQISDSLYVRKVAEDFYLAIERVDTKNLEMWQEYASRQVDVGKRMKLKYLRSIDGSLYFKRVLDDHADSIITPENEIWVAYASRMPVTQPAQLGKENPDLEMFVSVATSAKALLAAHMGISRTYEAAEDLEPDPPRRKKQPDQSLYLHAFAAQVMKLRNSERLYMITTPVPIMLTLLLNKLPAHAISIGDNLYRGRIESAYKNPQTLLWHELDFQFIPGETQEAREKRLRDEAQDRYHKFKIQEKFDLLKSHPPRIVIDKESDEITQCIIQTADDKVLMIANKNDAMYRWLFTPALMSMGLNTPYVMVDLAQLAAFGKIVPDRAPHA